MPVEETGFEAETLELELDLTPAEPAPAPGAVTRETAREEHQSSTPGPVTRETAREEQLSPTPAHEQEPVTGAAEGSGEDHTGIRQGSEKEHDAEAAERSGEEQAAIQHAIQPTHEKPQNTGGEHKGIEESNGGPGGVLVIANGSNTQIQKTAALTLVEPPSAVVVIAHGSNAQIQPPAALTLVEPPSAVVGSLVRKSSLKHSALWSPQPVVDVDPEKGHWKRRGFSSSDEEDEEDGEMARRDPLILGLLALVLVISIVALVLGSMALVRTNDAERFEPSVKVSLDGVCGSNGSGSLIAATPAPAAAVDDHAADDAADAAHDAGGAAHWGYTGAEGPLNWGSLHADWAMCASGVRQSPVNIKTVGPGGVDNAGPIDDITKKIAPTDFIDVSKMLPDNDFSDRVKAIHNGHAITCAGTQAYLTHAGSNWKLLQYHFHTPSEHSLDGTLFAAELHFVHQNWEGKYLVVGVFVKEGTTIATAFDQVLTDFPISSDQPAKPLNFDYTRALHQMLGVSPADAVLGANTSVPYFTYSGSFTTPPCTEDVTWVVLERPINFATDHIKKLEDAMGKNNRPTQPLNSRSIKKFS